ncbi:hypothetical protein [Micromonospora coxensis]|uniref:hypothetical protein n=1 Tax=Micromonospora coxensis TaxID=356852 RepID=UPI003F577278
MVLILESRSHLDLGDLPNLLAAELGVMTVRLERAIRSLDGVARVHVNRWGDGSAHLHMWFLARPYGRLQLRGTFLSLWDSILPPISESQWRENLALVAAWLAEFGGRPLAEPPRIQWQAPSSIADQSDAAQRSRDDEAVSVIEAEEEIPVEVDGETTDPDDVAQPAARPTADEASAGSAEPTATERTVAEPTAARSGDTRSGAGEAAAAGSDTAEPGAVNSGTDASAGDVPAGTEQNGGPRTGAAASGATTTGDSPAVNDR